VLDQTGSLFVIVSFTVQIIYHITSYQF